ncbi:MAG TPA: alpha/beta hydrolase-fold protein [Planctomycetaceae bacterium]|nr:alpha/beta hydrolase-fold protein [Planctomycetaceae bacterium]
MNSALQPSRTCCTLIVLAAALSHALLPSRAAAEDWRFGVKFTESVHKEPFTGRVYIFINNGSEPRRDSGWFSPGQFIARDVRDWKPGDTLEFANSDKPILVYPKPLAKLKLAKVMAQAVVRFNPFEREVGTGPGNGYSQVIKIAEPSTELPVLVIDHLVAPKHFVETETRKEFFAHSKLLSDFYGRDVSLSAAVFLPKNYRSDSAARYPVLFIIPGFGGTHYVTRSQRFAEESGGVEFIRVVLEPSCPLGHHVFADSANNGPVGQALVTEFLPAFDRAFRTVADPRARFLTGHSSGGWSSLWVQISHPDDFAGTWSTAPDPVDFRDFQQIDIYKPGTNMYVDSKGELRPVARMGLQPVLYYQKFCEMEDVLGPGGQLMSFEAVFGPSAPAADGSQVTTGIRRPRPLWDRKTGAIDLAVAKAWEQYDIHLVLERNWDRLGPKLAGKLHVFMGTEDTFYLEGAVRLLKQSLEKLKSDAVVELIPGKSHMNLLDRKLTERIQKEMAASYLASFPHAKRVEHKAAAKTPKKPWKPDWDKAIGSANKQRNPEPEATNLDLLGRLVK